MALKPADMESCDEKKRCLQGVNAGTAYTPGDECADGFTFNSATCDCDSDECLPCVGGGGTHDVQFCNWQWTDERGLTNVSLSSYGEPLISEPYNCGSTSCYFDVSQRQCDGTYANPTAKLAYCDGAGCADDGIQLTGPVASSCQAGNCDDVLCPQDEQTWNCELCECVSEYWAWVGTVVNTGAYFGPYTQVITLADWGSGGIIPLQLTAVGNSPTLFATSATGEATNVPDSSTTTAFNGTARSTRLAKSCFGGSGNIRIGEITPGGTVQSSRTFVNGLNCSDTEGMYIEGTGNWVQVDSAGNAV